MLRRPAALVVLVPLATVLTLFLIGTTVDLVLSRMVPIGVLTSAVVAGVLASRDHGPVRAGATGLGAAAIYVVLFLGAILLLLALADPSDYR